MEPEKWRKVKSIFNDVVELDDAEQEDFLRSHAAEAEIIEEVRKMLIADDESLIQHSPFSKLAEAETNGSKPPEKIGNYRILREVGRGGMGVVYEAVRDDGEFSQRVAIKIIKRGMDSDDILRRFRNERQILAELQHPNIARLFDGGVTESGSPYYVMEFIQGEAIDLYCRERDLSITEKLGLFRQVCAAVSYAHSQLIVHRDLKPSNMLITADGSVKLLDFGIAKVLNTDGPDLLGTATQLGMMTPAYASPEQIRGDKVTTVSDVYSLGVVFYQLLTGDRPYQTEGKSIAEMVDLVCNSELRRPSDATTHGVASPDIKTAFALKLKTQNRSFKGDLDNISLKALQKDPERRYSSVEQFSEDIRRHLIGQPITARPDTQSYRLKKFVSRNRGPVFAGTLIFISLCAGIGIALWQARKAEQQRTLAENRFTEVRELANSVIFKYHDAIASLPGSTAAREMLVKDATRYLDNLATESDEDPELQRELALAYVKLGDVLGKAYAANVGDTAGALESYKKAVVLLEKARSLKPTDATIKKDLVKGYEALFQIYMRNSDEGTKLETLDKAIKLQDELLAAEPGDPEYKLQKAVLLLLSGDSTATFRNKLPVFINALALGDELYATDPDNQENIRFLMRINQRLGTTYGWTAGEERDKYNDEAEAQLLYSQAVPHYERSLEMAKRLFDLDPRNISHKRNYAMGHTNLAEVYAKTGKRAECLALIEKAMSILHEMEAEDPRNREIKSDIAFAHESVAEALKSLGDTGKAVRELEKAITIQESIWRQDIFNDELMSASVRNCDKIIAIYEKTGDGERAAAQRKIKHDRNMEILKLRNERQARS